MSKKLVAVILVTACAVLLVSPGQAAENQGAFAPGRVIVKLKPGVTPSERAAIMADLGVTADKPLGLIAAEVWDLANLTVQDAVATYEGHNAIAYIEPDYILYADSLPNDPRFPEMYALQNTGQTGGTPGADIDAVPAWDIATGSEGVIVGIIDSGTDYNHADLSGNIWTNPGEIAGDGIDNDGNGFIDDVHGWDFYNGDNDPMDDYGHGTHTAGTVGAVGNNSTGVVGVCWTVKIMPLKFLGSTGSGPTTAAIECVQYATLMGADLTSNSWGGGSYSQALYDAIAAAGQGDVLFVSSAGNSGSDNDIYPHYPSSYDLDNIIAVAGTDHNDNMYSSSCYGLTSVDLGAPGVSILSTLPGNQYGLGTGTSMACPHVSGTAALIKAFFPGMPSGQIKTLIMNSTEPIPALAGKCVTEGRLNVLRCLEGPDSIPPDPVVDLAASGPGSNTMELTWTATGDDGAVGTASYYDVRYSTAPITAGNFDSATVATGPPVPEIAGAVQSMTVIGLAFNTTYYFAMKTHDDYGNPSAMSNVAAGTTLGIPDIAVSPDSLFEELLTGASATQTVTVSNIGEGTLDFEISLEEVTAAWKQGGGMPFPPAGITYDLDHSPSRGPLGPDDIVIANVTNSDLSVLLVQSGGDVSEIRSLLLAFPDISVVDEFDGEFGTPTLAYLQGYDAVFVLANYAFANPVGMGDVLADYVDDGGGLIMTVATFIAGWEVQGRLLTEGYIPFNIGGGPLGPANLGVFDPAHEIMEGITALWGDLRGDVTLATGADWVADYDDGEPLVATKGDHVAAINVFANMPGNWTGDVPLLFHNAAVWAAGSPWLFAAPTSGTVPAGSSVDVDVLFDATGLVGGDYQGNINISSNDPDPSLVTVPAYLHVTGAADIATSADTLDYGEQYIGASVPRVLTVLNRGTDSLRVSGISTDNTDYTVDLTAFALAAGEAQNVTVTFSPSVTGTTTGTLSILSDDPDEPTFMVALTGVGVEPPDIDVTPGELADTLLTGQTSVHTLTISNTGVTDLDWQIRIENYRDSIAGGGGLREMLLYDLPARTTTVTAGADGQMPETGQVDIDPVTMLGMDLTGIKIAYDEGHGQRTSTAVALLIADLELRGATVVVNMAPLTASNLDSFDILWLDEWAGSFTPNEIADIQAWVMNGGAIFQHGDEPDGATAIMTPFGFDYGAGGTSGITTDIIEHAVTDSVESVYINSPIAYLITSGDAVEIIYDAGGAAHCGVVDVGGGRVFAVADEDFHDGYIGSEDNRILGNNAIDWLAGGGWLSAEPKEGTVAPGASADVDVTFDATGLYGGDYLADLLVLSNDPDESEVLVPAYLQVIGVADISVSADSLDYGVQFIGSMTEQVLSVSNEGTDDLSVTGILSDNADYVVDITAFDLAPQETQDVTVTFSPSTVGSITGLLSITSDDPDEPTVAVALLGGGVEPPDIDVVPGELADTLLSNETSVHMLTISNTGVADLEWQIRVEAYRDSISAGEGSGTVRYYDLPARTATVTVGGDGEMPESEEASVGPVRILAADLTGITVAYDQSHGQRSPSSMSMLMADLELRGATVIINTVPLVASNLADIDVLWLDESGYSFTAQEITDIENWVNGGGAIFHHGDSPGETTTIMTLFGIDLASGGTSGYTTDIVAHPVTDGVDSVYLSGPMLYLIASGDAEVIVRDVAGVAHCGVVEVGSGRVFAVADDDFLDGYMGYAGNRVFGNNAIDWLAGGGWLSVEPNEGTVAPGASIDVEVTFDATGLYGGDYFADLKVLSNDPDEGTVIVPAYLQVIGVADISLSADSLDYGVRFLGSAAEESLVISNVGTDLLTVADISPDNADYTVDMTSFALLPGELQAVVVTFSPSTVGPIIGTLTITSDDPDEPVLAVALIGTGAEPPDIDVTPAMLADTLFSNETSVHMLTISNTGFSDLEWEIRVENYRDSIAGGSGPGAIGLYDLPTRTATVPVGADGETPESEHVSVGPVSILAADLTGITVAYDQSHGQRSSSSMSILMGDLELRGATVVINTAPLTASNLDDIDVLWFDEGASSFSSQEIADITSWLNNGGGIFHHGDSPGATTTLLSLFGIDFASGGSSGVTTNILEHPATEGVGSIYLSGPMLYVIISGEAEAIVYDIASVAHCGVAESGSGRILAVADDDFYDSYMSYNDNRLFGNNAIDWLAGGGWLRADPSEGTVAAGGSFDVEITFDATGLWGGEYLADLMVLSNDPDEGSVMVSAYLKVFGVPDIGVAPAYLDYDEVFVGSGADLALTVSNNGTDILSVTDISSDNTDYAPDTTSFDVPPGATQEVIVTFSPSMMGSITGTLTISSNDPDVPAWPVTLQGEGVPAPNIAVSPDTVSASRLVQMVKTASLRIDNTGEGALEYHLAAFQAPQPPPEEAMDLAKGEDDPRTGDPVLEGQGGPDGFGYTWIDSDEPGGPVYSWVDVSSVGTRIVSAGDDDNYGPFPIGFDFPFYGNTFDTFRICTNGFISFTSTSTAHNNQPLPSPYAPGNMLAVFWDDLFFWDDYSDAYHYYDGTRAIIQFIGIDFLFGGGYLDFEIILYPDGRIVYQYAYLYGELFRCTVGMQNADGTMGLNIAFNTDYLHSYMAVAINPSRGQWLSASPDAGTIPAGGHRDITVTMDGRNHGIVDLEGLVRIMSDDPDEPLLDVPVFFNSGNIQARYLELGPELSSGDTWIACSLGLPEGYGAGSVDLETMCLTAGIDGTVYPDQAEIVGPDSEGLYDIDLRFDRWDLADALPAEDPFTIVVTGQIDETTYLVGSTQTIATRPTLIQPNGGEVFETSEIDLAWEIPAGREADSYSLFFSGDAGQTWQEVASGITETTATVALPQISASACHIRVDVIGGIGLPGYDRSDQTFTVNVPSAGIGEDALPTVFALKQNKPNPFTGATNVRFDLPRDADVRLEIFDIKGRLVSCLVNETIGMGRHSVTWDGTDLRGNPVASGIYFYRLDVGTWTETKSMVVVR